MPEAGTTRGKLRCPVAGRGVEEDKVQEFIRKQGVTVCPGMGTKELAQFCAERERKYAESKSYTYGGHRKKKRATA